MNEDMLYEMADERGEGELTVHLATDAGLLAIIAPGGLAHRHGDSSWWTQEEDLLDEANAGRVIPIETGQDGGYAVRVTFGEQTSRERRFKAQSAEFWLKVPDDEELAVVAGEELSFPDTPGAATFWATSGTYHVTVTRLRWTEDDEDEAEDALPDYIARLRPFYPDEEPPVFESLPDLSLQDLF